MKMGNVLYAIFVIVYFFCPSLIHAKKILVTGGAGFIGSHVAQKLLERGDSVVIVDTMDDPYDSGIKQYNLSLLATHNFNNQLSIYKADICDMCVIEEICAQEMPDIICHLAALAGVRDSINNPHEYFRVNNNGTLVMFEMARKFNIQHIVCASSSSVYGIRQDGPFRETDSVDKQSSIYGVTKRAGELLAYVYYHLFGISTTNLRFFSVYGPRGRINTTPFLLMDALHHQKKITMYGDGTAMRDFVYIDDVVEGVVNAIDNPVGYEIINLGSGKLISLEDVVAIIETIIQKKADISYAKSFSGGVLQAHADISKAQELLHYVPTMSLECGLEAMYEWYTNEYLTVFDDQRKLYPSEICIMEY